MRILCFLTAVLLVIGFSTTATAATFLENFDGYATGTDLNDVGGWFGWYDNSSKAGIVSNAFARSGNNSIEIAGDTDAVHPFAGYESGTWILTAWQYIPSTAGAAPDANTYFIVNSKYAHDGSDNGWSIQLSFIDNSVTDDLDYDRTSFSAEIVFDDWVEIKNIIDLDNALLWTYYNGALLSSGTYYGDGVPSNKIAAIDLFASGGPAVYYDDISIVNASAVPEPTSLLLLGTGLGVIGLAAWRRRQ